MKPRNPVILTLALAVPIHCSSAGTVEAIIKTTDVIRDDIGRPTFGSGVDFNVPQFRWLMDTGTHAHGPSTATQQKIKAFNFGTMRFPSGDGAQLYQWDDPQHSYPFSNSADPWSLWLTQDQMLNYTSPSSQFADGLDMARLFQVNSSQYIDYNASWAMRHVNANFYNSSVQPEIDPAAVNHAAARAANWVQNNNGRPSHQFVEHWEVGNEDWIYWTGAQYGQIFDKFREKMVAKRPTIKLLAQGLSADFQTPANGTNTMVNWIDGLRANITNPATSVYAYSNHEYVNADEYASDTPTQRRIKQTQDMLSKVAAGTRMANLKTKLAESPLTSTWKIWNTEFNTILRVNGVLDNPQDMGQALVIADWTGKMLEQNVERMFFHALDHHPEFALIQYVNEGATIAAPRITVPGYAYSIFPQEFGKKMVRSTVGTTAYPCPLLTANAPSLPNYKQLAVYSSIREDSVNGDTLRVIVINRALTGVTTFNLKTENITGARRMKNAPAKYTYRQLRSSSLGNNNGAVADTVSWTAPLQYNSSEWGINGAALGPASVNLFIIPLQ